MTAELQFEILDWFQVHDLTIKIFVKLKKLKLNPDIIVAIARGGWVPARLFADLFKLKETSNVNIKFYETIGKRYETPVLTQLSKDELQGKTVLLVDDLVDSGESMKLAVQELKKCQIKKILTITLYKKDHSKFIPDFVANITKKWVVFPWEYFEFLEEFAENKSKEEIKKMIDILRSRKIPKSIISALEKTWSSSL